MPFRYEDKQSIVRSYEHAQDYDDQVTILSELNACRPQQIIEVLREANYVDDDGKLIYPVKGVSNTHLIKKPIKVEQPKPIRRPAVRPVKKEEPSPTEPDKKIDVAETEEPKRKKTRWTDEMIAHAYQMKRDRIPYDKIGSHFGVSRASIQQMFINHPVDPSADLTVTKEKDSTVPIPDKQKSPNSTSMSELEAVYASIAELSTQFSSMVGWFNEYLLAVGLEIQEDGKIYPKSISENSELSKGYLLGITVCEMQSVKERIEELVNKSNRS